MKIRLLLILITKETIHYAFIFVDSVKPNNYRNNRFQVNAQHLHGTTPSSIKINLHFEIRYRHGKEKNNHQIINNNIVYFTELFVNHVNNYGTLLIHQTKIVAQEEFITFPICLLQLQKEAREGVIFPNYL